MKPDTLKSILPSILFSLSIFTFFNPPDSVPQIIRFSVTSGVNLLGVALIGAILYLGYYVRSRYEQHHKTRNEKS